jgi:hypothetical protein
VGLSWANKNEKKKKLKEIYKWENEGEQERPKREEGGGGGAGRVTDLGLLRWPQLVLGHLAMVIINGRNGKLQRKWLLS